MPVIRIEGMQLARLAYKHRRVILPHISPSSALGFTHVPPDHPLSSFKAALFSSCVLSVSEAVQLLSSTLVNAAVLFQPSLPHPLVQLSCMLHSITYNMYNHTHFYCNKKEDCLSVTVHNRCTCTYTACTVCQTHERGVCGNLHVKLTNYIVATQIL